ncbi:MAG TPA: type II secretion system protein [Tepidisphaeraceae bacterium]|jgi:prepilin-type N-terminal cleavage/methylation domain-containing protein/prepilin-type processing-associated H-X9-DG protein|nr:type II secretion system protein [Tepidisphaeraceae bacterium]
MSKRRRGFTLVELLVVIGIIALLISILLPALSSARKAAATVKCASSLREIGNAMQMYSLDNKGYAAPGKLIGVYNGVTNPFWFNFLAKYVTKTKLGNAATNGQDVADAQHTVLWGCPAWDGYTAYSTYAGAANQTQPGYGLNGCPEYTSTYPGTGITLGDDAATSSGSPEYVNKASNGITPGTGTDWSNPSVKKWYKLTQYTHAVERAIAGDSLFWDLGVRPPINSGPPNFSPPAGQYTLSNNATWCSNQGDAQHETMFDFYRHGKYPGLKPNTTDEFSPTGGKVSFNVLFADGHVSNLIDTQSAYKCVRMRYPG